MATYTEDIKIIAAKTGIHPADVRCLAEMVVNDLVEYGIAQRCTVDPEFLSDSIQAFLPRQVKKIEKIQTLIHTREDALDAMSYMVMLMPRCTK